MKSFWGRLLRRFKRWIKNDGNFSTSDVSGCAAVALSGQGFGGVCEEGWDAAFAGVGRLSVLIKDKLTGRAEEALADLEKDPESEDNQADLRKQLEKALEEDPAFAEEVRALVEDVQAKGCDQVSQIMNVTGDNNQSYQVAGSGNVINN